MPKEKFNCSKCGKRHNILPFNNIRNIATNLMSAAIEGKRAAIGRSIVSLMREYRQLVEPVWKSPLVNELLSEIFIMTSRGYIHRNLAKLEENRPIINDLLDAHIWWVFITFNETLKQKKRRKEMEERNN